MTEIATQPVVITITLPTNEGEQATLLIQRGDLAHMRQFAYANLDDVASILHEAANSLTLIENDPPLISEVPPPASKAAVKPERNPEPQEPTIEVPLKKGSATIKISHLRITGGETDAAAYRHAVLIAGKLIDGGLWDGKTPISIDDVYTVGKKMKHLSDKELSLFTLKDFVQTCTVADVLLTQNEVSE